jgi:hypothetical protein
MQSNGPKLVSAVQPLHAVHRRPVLEARAFQMGRDCGPAEDEPDDDVELELLA